MAKYKCLPYYELTRNGKTITFDIDGFYETNDDSQIKLLDECKPFIKRVDEVKPKSAPKKMETKSKTTAKKPTSKNAKK